MSPTQTVTRAPTAAPTQPPTPLERLRQLGGLVARSVPLADRDFWSLYPDLGAQPVAMVREIRESVAFSRARARLVNEDRPTASPVAWLNRMASYQEMYYRDALRDGPRRLNEGQRPLAAAWQRPQGQPVREAMTRSNWPLSAYAGMASQLGVDTLVGLCALARVVALLVMLKGGRAHHLAFQHRAHLTALAFSAAALLGAWLIV